MPSYRLYCLDGLGKFTNVHDLAADDDVEAMEKAAQKKLGVNCELWDRGRLVAVLPAYIPSQQV